jgi:2-succinyl-6-hydroxy-2,4-cyclohexadiene-1-carboxylate synthase
VPLIYANGLAFQVAARGAGEPLVLLHGFTGGAATWAPLLDRLPDDRRMIAIDLIGHGASSAPADPARYAFDLALADLAAIVAALGIDRAAWLGYSMGSRLALGLAVRSPGLVSDLILESATPGIQDDAERQRRVAADAALAARIETDGVAAFVAEWEQLPLWESQRSLPAAVLARQREIRLRNQSIGLANSLRGMGQGAQPSNWDRLGDLTMPVLLLAGECDAKYARIATQMHEAIPHSHVALVPHAGHAVHLEAPAIFADLVSRFLAGTTATTFSE